MGSPVGAPPAACTALHALNAGGAGPCVLWQSACDTTAGSYQLHSSPYAPSPAAHEPAEPALGHPRHCAHDVSVVLSTSAESQQPRRGPTGFRRAPGGTVGPVPEWSSPGPGADVGEQPEQRASPVEVDDDVV
jgi:hypothetical protein